jgi:hypothetical protein
MIRKHETIEELIDFLESTIAENRKYLQSIIDEDEKRSIKDENSGIRFAIEEIKRLKK